MREPPYDKKREAIVALPGCVFSPQGAPLVFLVAGSIHAAPDEDSMLVKGVLFGKGLPDRVARREQKFPEAARQRQPQEHSPDGAPGRLNANGPAALAVIATYEILDGDRNPLHREQILTHMVLSASRPRSSGDKTPFLVSEAGGP
jgi:hypothetical protein